MSRAFGLLKKRHSEETILCVSNYSKAFVIQTVTFDKGIRVVLAPSLATAQEETRPCVYVNIVNIKVLLYIHTSVLFPSITDHLFHYPGKSLALGRE